MSADLETVLALAQDLSPADQSRLMARLAAWIEQVITGRTNDELTDTEEEDPPAFWHMPESDAEWEEMEARWAEQQRHPPSPEEAEAHVQNTLKQWAPTYLSEEEALDIAMSEDISEWNLDL